jgi:hypothetical protein
VNWRYDNRESGEKEAAVMIGEEEDARQFFGNGELTRKMANY